MAGKGTRHRFELSRLEIAGVIVSAVAGLFVVFMLGIYAGRGLSERRPDGGEQIVRVPVAPAVEQTPDAEERLTFYDTLGAENAEQKPSRPERAAPPEEHVAKPVVPEPPIAAKEAHPEPVAKSEPIAKPEPTAARRDDAAARTVVPTPAAKAKAERSPAPPSTARVAVALAAPTPTTKAPSRGDWSVQVSATRDPRTADGVLRRLQAKGYEAFVLKVRRRGETFYRVRVGHYESLEEAQQVVSRLRREPGVPEAFVASD